MTFGAKLRESKGTQMQKISAILDPFSQTSKEKKKKTIYILLGQRIMHDRKPSLLPIVLYFHFILQIFDQLLDYG